MPSARINEVDNTTYRNPTIVNRNTVLVAGRATRVSGSGTIEDPYLPKVGKPILCDTLAEFYSNFGRELGKYVDVSPITISSDEKVSKVISQKYDTIGSLYVDINQMSGVNIVAEYRAIFKKYLLDNTGNGELYLTKKVNGVYQYSSDFTVTITPGTTTIVDTSTINITTLAIVNKTGDNNVYNFSSGEFTINYTGEVYGKKRYGYDYAVDLLTAGLSVLYVPYSVYGNPDSIDFDEMDVSVANYGTTGAGAIFDIVFSADHRCRS